MASIKTLRENYSRRQNPQPARTICLPLEQDEHLFSDHSLFYTRPHLSPAHQHPPRITNCQSPSPVAHHQPHLTQSKFRTLKLHSRRSQPVAPQRKGSLVVGDCAAVREVGEIRGERIARRGRNRAESSEFFKCQSYV
jgi:hypothetical protein